MSAENNNPQKTPLVDLLRNIKRNSMAEITEANGWSYFTNIGELAYTVANELDDLTAELETVKRERDAAIALLSKMAKEEPCDNDGRGCPCVEMAYDFVAALKAGKA